MNETAALYLREGDAFVGTGASKGNWHDRAPRGKEDPGRRAHRGDRRDRLHAGVHGQWIRLRIPVVAGEPVRATSRATLPMDCVNLIGITSRAPGVSMINADVSGHVFRLPLGEWVAMTGHTHFDHAVGHGISTATLSDRDGVFGVTSTSQIVQHAG